MEQMDPERVKRIAIAEMKLVEIQVIQMESQKNNMYRCKIPRMQQSAELVKSKFGARSFLVSLDVEINPRFYRGIVKRAELQQKWRGECQAERL